MLPAVNLPFVREIAQHFPPASARSARPRLKVVGPVVVTLALLLALPLDTACFCNPPSRPTMESCSDPSSDFSGVTGVAITGARYVNGIQGGSHFQFEIVATGTSLPTCFAYEGVLGGPTAPDTALSGTIRASDEGDGTATSRTIYIFSPPFQIETAFELEVTALGRTASTSSSVDGGTTGDVGP